MQYHVWDAGTRRKGNSQTNSVWTAPKSETLFQNLVKRTFKMEEWTEINVELFSN